MGTRRQRIVELLQQRDDGWSPRDLALALEADERTVLEDLRHVKQTLRGSGLELLMLPARCTDCGWEGERDAPRNPGRCPKCRATRLQPARFRVGLAERRRAATATTSNAPTSRGPSKPGTREPLSFVAPPVVPPVAPPCMLPPV
ncbi:MAG: hypothetical protein LC624_12490, partial [Halobacteriales archaeon]|nr:hypothetical protein [Halobacteriales archaeon]